MTTADASPPIALSTSTANILAAAFTGLAEARGERELFAAALLYLRTLGPCAVDLYLGTQLEDGRPTHARAVAWWADDPAVDLPPPDDDVDIRLHPFAQMWWGQGAPLFFEDVDADPRCGADYRAARSRQNVRAQVKLPLHSEAVGRVIGVLVAHFREPRRFSGEERHVLKTLSVGIASFLASRRLLAAQEEALRAAQRERRMLQAVIDNLPIGVYLAEAGTARPLLANQLGADSFGRDRVEPDGTVSRELYTTLRSGTREPYPYHELPLVQTLATGERCDGVVDVLRSEDGRIVTLELSSAPVRDEAGVMFAAVVVYVDVTERNRAEAERTQIREELIRSQAAALAERSTPLIPLSDDVVAMPIIGALDGARADQVVDVLLAGCAARKARCAILDITGVPHADAAVARAILRAAAAVRLLGVEPILTGIRPDVARTLAGLDVDLRGVVTLSTLQDGIRHAARPR